MEQKPTKRCVGRPRGSTRINDDAPLTRVAEILLDRPKMRPTSAMKQVLHSRPATTEAGDRTILRRWQHAWKTNSGRYFEMAKAKRRPTVSARPSSSGVVHMFAANRIAESLAKANAFAGALDPATMLAAQEVAKAYVDSPAYKAAMGFMDSPAYKVAMGLMDSPAYRAMQEPAIMRRFREQ
jgi:hypothetical protein